MAGVLALLGLLAAQAPDVPEVELRQPMALPIVVHTPTQQTGRISTSQILAALSAEIARGSILVPRELPNEIVDSCRGAFACVFRHPTLVGFKEPVDLVWVSHFTAASESQVSFQLVDVGAAVAAARTTTVSDVELYVLERAVVASTERTAISSVAELEAAARAFVGDAIRPRAVRSRMWGRSGSVRVSSNVSPMQLEVDGVYRRELASPVARMTGVPVGEREFVFKAADYEPLRLRVEVDGARDAALELRLVHEATLGGAVRTGVKWGGLGAAVLGAAGIATGLALSAPKSTCLVGPGEHCSRLGPGQPFVGPGTGLLVGGLSAWFGAVFFGEEFEWPWIGLLGALAFGVGSGVAVGASL
ncbi:MAG: hypothetical protein U1E65_03655 [Myxococcota bacterium]